MSCMVSNCDKSQALAFKVSKLDLGYKTNNMSNCPLDDLLSFYLDCIVFPLLLTICGNNFNQNHVYV